MKALTFSGPETGPLFVFAHGAGAPLNSSFMEHVAQGLSEQGIRVIRFNFDYMQQRIETGSRRPPERAPKLITQWQNIIDEIAQPMVIGGKSMGGRMASLLAAQTEPSISPLVKGIACLGYPFHPQGKPEKLRIEHFCDITLPLAIMQGTRDKLGNKEEILDYSLAKKIHWCWLEDGDHDLKPRVKSGFTHQQHLQTTVDYLANFIKSCMVN